MYTDVQVTCDVCYLFSELPLARGTLWRGVLEHNGGLPGAIAASLVLTNQPTLCVCVCVCVCVYKNEWVWGVCVGIVYTH